MNGSSGTVSPGQSLSKGRKTVVVVVVIVLLHVMSHITSIIKTSTPHVTSHTLQVHSIFLGDIQLKNLDLNT